MEGALNLALRLGLPAESLLQQLLRQEDGAHMYQAYRRAVRNSLVLIYMASSTSPAMLPFQAGWILLPVLYQDRCKTGMDYPALYSSVIL